MQHRFLSFKSFVIYSGLVLALMLFSFSPSSKGKHLFILSGQSNMEALKPEESLIPTLEAALGAENILVVKDAKGGMPIRCWFNNEEGIQEEAGNSETVLYDSLIRKVKEAIENEKIASVNFLWMQGERDAREGLGGVYEASLKGLISRLSKDLKRDDLNVVIGRLSDFDLSNKNYPHWTIIREIQVKLAESDTRIDWIDTDDLNDGLSRSGKMLENDLHLSSEGYVTLGRRFAQKALLLISGNK